jgi:hypothetical protein
VGCAFVTGETPEAHEVAYKGAVTDALKRALRHFGEQFGLGLYDRRNAVDATSPKGAMSARRNGSPPKLDSMRRKVLDLSGRLGVARERSPGWSSGTASHSTRSASRSWPTPCAHWPSS